MAVHDRLVAAVMQIQHQYRIEINITRLITDDNFLMAVYRIPQDMYIDITYEKLILPVNNHIIPLLIGKVIISIHQLHIKPKLIIVFVGHDIDYAVFIVEEDTLDLAYLVFIVDVELHLLLDVDEKAIVLVGNDEDFLKVCAFEVLRLSSKGLLEFVDVFGLSSDEIH